MQPQQRLQLPELSRHFLCGKQFHGGGQFQPFFSLFGFFQGSLVKRVLPSGNLDAAFSLLVYLRRAALNSFLVGEDIAALDATEATALRDEDGAASSSSSSSSSSGSSTGSMKSITISWQSNARFFGAQSMHYA
eukprot:scaffold171263_cov63-Cyclotella_meneghiniana.AAC.1